MSAHNGFDKIETLKINPSCNTFPAALTGLVKSFIISILIIN
jgi:hypothetical protein